MIWVGDQRQRPLGCFRRQRHPGRLDLPFEHLKLRDDLRHAAQMWEHHDRSDDRIWTGTAYREFAPGYAGQTVALAQRIVEYTLECMRPFERPGGEAANRKLVEPDAQLNAQGLEVWLSRLKITAQGN